MQGLYRGTGEKISYFETVVKNVLILEHNFEISLLIGIVGALVNLVIYRKHELNIIKNLTKVLPYVIICIMPFAWYFVLRGHSWEHAYFTYRALTLSLICIPLMFTKLLEGRKNT